MSDSATPNLPSRDMDATAAFYARLGFSTLYKDERWMVLRRGTLSIEFFPHPALQPAESWFSCCLRLDDLAAFYETCRASGLHEADTGVPRLHAPTSRDGMLAGALVDLDGSLLRLIQN